MGLQERLTTRNSEGVAVLKTPYQCERCGEEIYRLADYGSGEPIEKLAGLEDLEEHGKLLKLPCALGSTIYRIGKCEAPNCERCRGYTWVGNCYTDYKGRIFVERFWHQHIDSYGKTVFLTRKEAEEALKRMEDGK